MIADGSALAKVEPVGRHIDRGVDATNVKRVMSADEAYGSGTLATTVRSVGALAGTPPGIVTTGFLRKHEGLR